MALFTKGNITVGLDIGSGLIKAAVIDHSRGEPELTRVAMTRLMPDAIVDGEIMDSGIVADAIRSTIEVLGVKPNRVVSAVSGRDVILKRIQTEKVKESLALALIKMEAEQHIPDMDGVEIDFQILSENEFDDEMLVLLVAAKRDLIDSRVRLIQEAGLEMSILDVESIALSNVFKLNYESHIGGGIAIINVGHDSTGINILDDGVPVINRDIGVGTRHFSEDLQREHSFSSRDADAVLRGRDVTPELEAVIELKGGEIAATVERAATFLGTYGKSATEISSIYMCGGGSSIPGLANYLGERLGTPVRFANPIKSLSVADSAFGELNVEDVTPLLMVSIGLALRGRSN